MIYKKPDMKYTDMCIYIDNTVYTDNRDDELVYQYLYHISNMLAHKGNYFNNAKYYDDFAIYAASKLFMRLIDPKQFMIEPSTNLPKLKPIKSILNYAKSKMYPLKVDFEQENYYQSVMTDDEGMSDVELNYTYKDRLVEYVDDLSRCDFNLCIMDIANITKEYLKRIPYKQGTSTWYNIYTSCLLTMLNSITLPYKSVDKIRNCKQVEYAQTTLESKLYSNEREDVIVFHLDNSMRTYIKVLVNELRHVFAENLSSTLDTYIPPMRCLDDVKYANG